MLVNLTTVYDNMVIQDPDIPVRFNDVSVLAQTGGDNGNSYIRTDKWDTTFNNLSCLPVGHMNLYMVNDAKVDFYSNLNENCDINMFWMDAKPTTLSGIVNTFTN